MSVMKPLIFDSIFSILLYQNREVNRGGSLFRFWVVKEIKVEVRTCKGINAKSTSEDLANGDWVKYLVVYYSRTGNTKNLAHQIAEAFDSDIDEILDTRKRKGVGGWLSAGRDATGKRDTDITVEKNPLDYDVIIIGTPIWASNLTPAIRKYLKTFDLQGKKVAFFATSAGDGQSEVFAQMRALCLDIEDLGSFGTSQKRMKAGEHEVELKAFLEGLK